MYIFTSTFPYLKGVHLASVQVGFPYTCAYNTQDYNVHIRMYMYVTELTRNNIYTHAQGKPLQTQGQ